MMVWGHLKELIGSGEACVLVSVAGARGSTPREPGAKMIVTKASMSGTIGGGHLEYVALRTAREMLGAGTTGPRIEHVSLGPSLGQCCGGRTTLLYEPFSPGRADLAWLDALRGRELAGESVLVVSATDGAVPAKLVMTGGAGLGSLGESTLDDAAREIAGREGDGAEPRLAPVSSASGERLLFIERLRSPGLVIVVFGAGHVARALVPMLAALPARITWIDPREDQFPRHSWDNVSIEVSDAPDRDVDYAAAGAYFLVMTHSHDLDFRITERILRRGDFAYLGLIGSVTKRRRFEKHLQRRGIPARELDRLTCPIGIAGVKGKWPAEIAIAVAAQILQLRDAGAPAARRSAVEPLSA